MEEEVRQILRHALAQDSPAPQQGLGTCIAARFAGLGLTDPLPELHQHVNVVHRSFDVRALSGAEF